MQITPINHNINNVRSTNTSFGKITVDEICELLPKDCFEKLNDLKNQNPIFNLKKLLNYENRTSAQKEKINIIFDKIGKEAEDIETIIYTNGIDASYPGELIEVNIPSLDCFGTSLTNDFEVGNESHGHNPKECFISKTGMHVPTIKTLEDMIKNGFNKLIAKMIYKDLTKDVRCSH